MGYVAANNAASVLAASITNGATTLSIQTTDIPKFPTINHGGAGEDYTYLTLQDSSNNVEIVKVTRHDTASASFTVVRGQDGTTARSWSLGDLVALRLNAGVVTDAFARTYAAQASEAAAAAYAAAAAASFDSFDDRFLGTKASEPTTDNDGNPLVEGALYFATHTTPKAMRFYDGASWQTIQVGITQSEADVRYLMLNAKAADSELLDGFNSTAFLRAVNGVGPDANGNVAVNVDLSSRVAKTGDSMSGNLTLPSATITGTAPTLTMQDTDNVTRKLHVNGGLMGFLNSSDGWDMYSNNSGQIWTSNYGWLHDRFAAKSAEAALDRVNNCSWNCVSGGYSSIGVTKSGSQLHLHFNNCNCDCYCFPAGTMVRMKDGTSRPIESVLLGDALQSGVGDSAIVAALHTVKLGSRKAYCVNGAVVTTGDHLFRTVDGWASLEPELYASLRYNQPSTVETESGLATINASAIEPSRVTLVTIGSMLLTTDGETSVTSIEVVDLPPDETLYSFMTEGAHTFVADGFVVDGAPQENI